MAQAQRGALVVCAALPHLSEVGHGGGHIVRVNHGAQFGAGQYAVVSRIAHVVQQARGKVEGVLVHVILPVEDVAVFHGHVQQQPLAFFVRDVVAEDGYAVQPFPVQQGDDFAGHGEVGSGLDFLHKRLFRDGCRRLFSHDLRYQVVEDVLPVADDAQVGARLAPFVALVHRQGQHAQHGGVDEMQFHVCAIGHQSVAEGAENVVELVALLHQLLLHHQAGLHLLAPAAFELVQVQQPDDDGDHHQEQHNRAGYQPPLMQLRPRRAEDVAVFFHHVPAQAELLHGFQVVEEGPFPVGESQRCRVGSFQHPGGHQARLVAHVVGLHVVGAKAAAADGQVLERIDGGGKRVGGHKGHELMWPEASFV